jgi:hypothetical protein
MADIPPHVRAEVQRVLDAWARRVLADELASTHDDAKEGEDDRGRRQKTAEPRRAPTGS